MALTPKRQRFVEEYLVDLNATQAAIRSGYSPKTANEQGSRLLADANVASAIAEAKKARSEATKVTAERVLIELCRIAYSDPRKLYRPDGSLKSPSEWDDDTAAAIAQVETEEEITPKADGGAVRTRTVKVKRWDKNAALHNLMKHLGMITDRVKLDAPPPQASPLVSLTDDQLRAIVATLQAPASSGN